jgi:hypothetical protein
VSDSDDASLSSVNITTFLLARLAENTTVDTVHLRAHVERHNDRTMVVVSGGTRQLEYVTRCGTCPKESTTPCRILREMASEYSRHPDFDSGWECGTCNPGIPASPGRHHGEADR